MCEKIAKVWGAKGLRVVVVGQKKNSVSNLTHHAPSLRFNSLNLANGKER